MSLASYSTELTNRKLNPRRLDPYKRDLRIGRWITFPELPSIDPQAALAVQREVVILGAHFDGIYDRVVWHGYCPSFDIVDRGALVPLYRPILQRATDDSVTILRWERVEG